MTETVSAVIVNKLGLHARAAAKLIKISNSYSCDIEIASAGDAENFVDGKSILALMLLAAGQGQTLIIPKKHAENIWEIDADDLAAIHRASKQVATAIRTALDPLGVACLQLNGRGVNQVVMHYHLHLIPRLPGKPELTMTEWELLPGDMDAIKETAGRIAAAL